MSRTMAKSRKIDISCLPSLIDSDRDLASRALANFVKLAWQVMEPEAKLLWGWCVQAICEHLEAVTFGQIKRLLINVPPGCAKSLLTCVFWTAWEWGPMARPDLRVIGSSYSDNYAIRDTRKTRDLVSSEWYQARWGDQVSLKLTGDKLFSNDRRGERQGIPFGSLTGGRGDRVIIDDPHSTKKAESEADRKTAIRIFRESLPTRLNNPEKSAIVVIMQRLHEDDVSGEILKNDLGYEHLMLPMEYEEKHPHKSVTCLGFEDPRTEEGELLFPERFPAEVVERDKKALGSFAVAGQFQQRPDPRGGGIVKRLCFNKRFVSKGEDPLRVMQSWDTASSTKLTAARSCCLTAAEFRDRLEIWYCFSERLRFAQLEQAVKDQAALFKPTVILIEAKSSGISLVQDLEDDPHSQLPVKAWDPGKLDKNTRLQVETNYLEAGHVRLPADAPWVANFIDRVCAIPTGTDRDEGDALSQLLRYRRENPVILTPQRPRVIRKRSNRF